MAKGAKTIVVKQKTAKRKDTKIFVDHGVKTQIAEAFGCTSQYVGQCLRAETQCDLAIKIRHTAISEYKGVEQVK